MHHTDKVFTNDIDDEFAAVGDISRSVFQCAVATADIDCQHRRIVADECVTAKGRGIDQSGSRQARNPGDRARHDNADKKFVGGIRIEIFRGDFHNQLSSTAYSKSVGLQAAPLTEPYPAGTRRRRRCNPSRRAIPRNRPRD